MPIYTCLTCKNEQKVGHLSIVRRLYNLSEVFVLDHFIQTRTYNTFLVNLSTPDITRVMKFVIQDAIAKTQRRV